MPAAEFVGSLAAAIMRKANSIGRWLRQTGRLVPRSSRLFTPLPLVMACSHGLLPGAANSDGPIQPGEIDGAGNWSPGNSDGTYGGIRPCSYGLIHSRNTMSVRVGQLAGLDTVQKVANDLGIAQNIPHGPASYIGSFESNLKDLTSAYTVFPNAGAPKQAHTT